MIWLGLAFMFWIVIAIIAIIAWPDGTQCRNSDPFEYVTKQYGSLNIAILCPHCQEKGKVRTKTILQKKGISGGKVMGGLVTGGVSLLATGLSRKESMTQAHCGNCSIIWHF